MVIVIGLLRILQKKICEEGEKERFPFDDN